MLDTSQISQTKIDKLKGTHLPTELSKDLAYLCGVLAGDGSIRIQYHKHNYTIKCVGNPKDEREFYDEILYNLFLKLFNYKIKTKLLDSKTTYGFEFASKSLVLFFTEVVGLPNKKKDDLRIPEIILKNKELTKSFIQGLMDTDGSVRLYKSRKNQSLYPSIALVSKSETLIDQVQNFLIDLSFKANKMRVVQIDKRFGKTTTFSVYMTGHKQLIRYLDYIGFKHPKHLSRVFLWKLKLKNKKIIAEDGVSLDKISYPNLKSTVEH